MSAQDPRQKLILQYLQTNYPWRSDRATMVYHKQEKDESKQQWIYVIYVIIAVVGVIVLTSNSMNYAAKEELELCHKCIFHKENQLDVCQKRVATSENKLKETQDRFITANAHLDTCNRVSSMVAICGIFMVILIAIAKKVYQRHVVGLNDLIAALEKRIQQIDGNRGEHNLQVDN